MSHNDVKGNDVKGLVALSCALFTHAFSVTMLFPFVGFMVVDMGIALTVNEAGYYTGWHAKCHACIHFISRSNFNSIHDWASNKQVPLRPYVIPTEVPVVLYGVMCLTRVGENQSFNLQWSALLYAL